MEEKGGYGYLVALEPGCNKDSPVILYQCGSVDEAKHILSGLIRKVVTNSSEFHLDDYYIIPDHNNAPSESCAQRWHEYIESGRLIPLNSAVNAPYYFSDLKDEQSYLRALHTTRYEHLIKREDKNAKEEAKKEFEKRPKPPEKMGARICWTEATLQPELLPDFLPYATAPFSSYIPYHIHFLTPKNYQSIIDGSKNEEDHDMSGHKCGVHKFYIIRSDAKFPPLNRVPFFQI